MGIQGLLPLLKDIQHKTSVSSFKGQKVGIDAYCWLHKGTYACAKDLVMGKPTRVYVNYVMKRVRMLINFGVVPILVFDGGRLPAKAGKEEERRKKRKEYREKGLAAMREENTSLAFDCFQKACDVSPEMASHVIQECAKINVQCIVAPYEADAQLAYLMIQGITQLTISEDSDLLLYGCNRVLYKMGNDGDGILIDTANLSKVRTVKLASFTMEQFRWMCMLSGCDYLPSIKGMGLIKAFKLLQRHKTIKQCIRAMKIDRNLFVPPEYEGNFRKAELVFKYQLVFDPQKRECVQLTSAEDETDGLSQADLDYAGPKLSQIKSVAIALGNIDPISGKTIGKLNDFASGDITHVPKKSNSWMTTSNTQPSIAKYRNNKIEAIKRKSASTNDVNKESPVTDLTPPSSGLLDEKCASKKSLFSSPEACAVQSLKRLSSELSEESSSSESHWKKLYQTSEPPNKRRNHLSVFNKTSRFRNPFQKKLIDHDIPDNTTVISRYFSSRVTTDSSPQNAPPESEAATTNEIDLSLPVTQKSPSGNLNCSFIDYLDQTNCRMTGPPLTRKRNLSKSPKKPVQQKKIDFTAKENKPIRGEEEEQSPPHEREPLSPVEKNNVPCTPPRSSDENIDFEITEKNSEDVTITGEKNEEKQAIFYIDDNDEKPIKQSTVLCENSFLEDDSLSRSPADDDPYIPCDIHTPEKIVNAEKIEHIENSLKLDHNIHELDERPILTSQESLASSQDLSQGSRQKLKIGLSKSRCSGIGASSFVNRNDSSSSKKKSPQKITKMLEKFQNASRDSLFCKSSNSSDSISQSCTKLHTEDSESVLTPTLPSSSEVKPKVSSASSKRTLIGLQKTCKPIGLRRKKKKNDSKTNDWKTTAAAASKDGLVQSKLSFNKFAYQKRKSFTSEGDDDIVVIG